MQFTHNFLCKCVNKPNPASGHSQDPYTLTVRMYTHEWIIWAFFKGTKFHHTIWPQRIFFRQKQHLNIHYTKWTSQHSHRPSWHSHRASWHSHRASQHSHGPLHQTQWWCVCSPELPWSQASHCRFLEWKVSTYRAWSHHEVWCTRYVVEPSWRPVLQEQSGLPSHVHWWVCYAQHGEILPTGLDKLGLSVGTFHGISIRTCTHTHTDTHRYTHMHAHTHTHKHMHTRTHVRAQTHTHTHSVSLLQCSTHSI